MLRSPCEGWGMAKAARTIEPSFLITTQRMLGIGYGGLGKEWLVLERIQE